MSLESENWGDCSKDDTRPFVSFFTEARGLSRRQWYCKYKKEKCASDDGYKTEHRIMGNEIDGMSIPEF
jgi:hypothetical protein